MVFITMSNFIITNNILVFIYITIIAYTTIPNNIVVTIAISNNRFVMIITKVAFRCS